MMLHYKTPKPVALTTGLDLFNRPGLEVSQTMRKHTPRGPSALAENPRFFSPKGMTSAALLRLAYDAWIAQQIAGGAV